MMTEAETTALRSTSTHGLPYRNVLGAIGANETYVESHAEDSICRTIAARTRLHRWEPRSPPGFQLTKGGPWQRYTLTILQHAG